MPNDHIDPSEGHSAPPDADEIVARLRSHLRGVEDPYGLSEREWDEAARECDVPVGAISGAIQGRVLSLWSQDHHADMVDADQVFERYANRDVPDGDGMEVG